MSLVKVSPISSQIHSFLISDLKMLLFYEMFIVYYELLRPEGTYTPSCLSNWVSASTCWVVAESLAPIWASTAAQSGARAEEKKLDFSFWRKIKKSQNPRLWRWLANKFFMSICAVWRLLFVLECFHEKKWPVKK